MIRGGLGFGVHFCPGDSGSIRVEDSSFQRASGRKLDTELGLRPVYGPIDPASRNDYAKHEVMVRDNAVYLEAAVRVRHNAIVAGGMNQVRLACNFTARFRVPRIDRRPGRGTSVGQDDGARDRQPLHELNEGGNLAVSELIQPSHVSTPAGEQHGIGPDRIRQINFAESVGDLLTYLALVAVEQDDPEPCPIYRRPRLAVDNADPLARAPTGLWSPHRPRGLLRLCLRLGRSALGLTRRAQLYKRQRWRVDAPRRAGDTRLGVPPGARDRDREHCR